MTAVEHIIKELENIACNAGNEETEIERYSWNL